MYESRQGVRHTVLFLFLLAFHSLSFSDSTEIHQLPPLLGDVAQEAFYNNDLEKVKRLITKPEIFEDPIAAYYSAMLLVKHRTLLDTAFALYNRAAAKNHPGAMFQLAQMYETGIFVEQDLVSALDWYHKSELQSTLPPRIDALNIDGVNVQSPIPESILLEHLHKNAQADNSQAQLQLGLFYEKGQWVDASWAQAIYWYERAAENGSEQAGLNMGLFYCKGIYLDKNIEQANKYFSNTNRKITCH